MLGRGLGQCAGKENSITAIGLSTALLGPSDHCQKISRHLARHSPSLRHVNYMQAMVIDIYVMRPISVDLGYVSLLWLTRKVNLICVRAIYLLSRTSSVVCFLSQKINCLVQFPPKEKAYPILKITMHFSKAIVAALLAAANVAMALPLADGVNALSPREELEPENRGGQVYISMSLMLMWISPIDKG